MAGVYRGKNLYRVSARRKRWVGTKSAGGTLQTLTLSAAPTHPVSSKIFNPTKIISASPSVGVSTFSGIKVSLLSLLASPNRASTPTLLYSADYETGTPPNALSTADSPSATDFDLVTVSAGNTLTYSATPLTIGSVSAAHTVGTGVNCYWRWQQATFGLQTQFYIRGYFQINQTSSSVLTWDLMWGRNSAATLNLWEFVVVGNNSGKNLRIRTNGGSIVQTGTASIPDGTNCRIEGFVDHTNSRLVYNLYIGSNLEGSTPDETWDSGASGVTLGDTSTAEMRVGPANSASACTIYSDAIGVSTANWIGSAIQTGGNTFIVKIPGKVLLPSTGGQGSAVFSPRSAFKIFLASPSHPVASIINSITKTFSVSPGHPVSSIVNFVSRALSVAPTHPVATVLRTPGRILSSIGQGSTALLRTPGKVLSAAPTHPIASFIKTPTKALLATGQASATKIISILKNFITTGQGSTIFNRSLTHTFSVSVSQVAQVLRTAIHVFSVIGQGSSIIIRLPQRTLSVIGQGSVAIVKAPQKILSSIGQGSATITAIKVAVLTLTASPTHPIVSLIRNAFKNLSVTGNTNTTFSRSLSKFFAAVPIHPSASFIRLPLRTLSVVGQGSAVILRTALRAISVIGQSSVVLIKTPGRILSVVGQGNSFTIKLPNKNFLTTVTATASIRNLISKVLVSIGQGVADFSTASGASATFAAIGNTVANIVKTPSFNLLTIGSSSASISSSISKSWSVVGNATTTFVRLPQKSLIATGQGNSIVSRTITKIFLAASSSISVFIRSVVRNLSVASIPTATVEFALTRTFFVVGQGSANLIKLPAKIFLSIGQGSAALDLHSLGSAVTFSVTTITSTTFITSAKKSLSVIGNSSVSALRVISRTFFTQNSGIATVLKTPIRTFVVIGQASASLIRTSQKRFLSTGTSTVIFSRVLTKNFIVSISLVTILKKSTTRIFAVISQGSAIFETFQSKFVSFSAVGQGSSLIRTVALKNLSIAANGITTFSRALSKNFIVVTQNQATFIKKIFRTFAVIGQGSAVFDLLRHVPIIRGFYTAFLKREGYYRSYITKEKSDAKISRSTSNSYVTRLDSDGNIIKEGYSDGKEF